VKHFFKLKEKYILSIVFKSFFCFFCQPFQVEQSVVSYNIFHEHFFFKDFELLCKMILKKLSHAYLLCELIFTWMKSHHNVIAEDTSWFLEMKKKISFHLPAKTFLRFLSSKFVLGLTGKYMKISSLNRSYSYNNKYLFFFQYGKQWIFHKNPCWFPFNSSNKPKTKQTTVKSKIRSKILYSLINMDLLINFVVVQISYCLQYFIFIISVRL